MNELPAAPTNPEETTVETVDCRSEEGVTAGLIDSIIAIARVAARRDLKHFAVVDALHDLRGDEDVRVLLADPVSAPVSTEDTDLRATLLAAMQQADEAEWGIGAPGVAGFTDAALSVVRPLLEAKDARISELWQQDQEHQRNCSLARRGRDEALAAAKQLRHNLRDLATHAYKCGLVDTVGDDIDPLDTIGNALDAGQVAAAKVAQLQQEREERATRDLAAAPVSSVEPEQDEFEGLCGAHYPPEPGTRCDRPPHHPKESHADGGFYWLDAQFPPAVPEQAQPREPWATLAKTAPLISTRDQRAYWLTRRVNDMATTIQRLKQELAEARRNANHHAEMHEYWGRTFDEDVLPRTEELERQRDEALAEVDRLRAVIARSDEVVEAPAGQDGAK